MMKFDGEKMVQFLSLANVWHIELLDDEKKERKNEGKEGRGKNSSLKAYYLHKIFFSHNIFLFAFFWFNSKPSFCHCDFFPLRHPSCPDFFSLSLFFTLSIDYVTCKRNFPSFHLMVGWKKINNVVCVCVWLCCEYVEKMEISNLWFSSSRDNHNKGWRASKGRKNIFIFQPTHIFL